MKLRDIAFYEGINDYFWRRTKPPTWMNKDEKSEWRRGQELAKTRIYVPVG